MMPSSSHLTARISRALSKRSDNWPLVAENRRNGSTKTAAIRLIAVAVGTEV